MNKKFYPRRRKKNGFTLIELLIIVVIIGILAVLTIPIYGEVLGRVRDGSTKANLAIMRSALAVFYANNEGQYPSFPPPRGQAAGYGNILDVLVPQYLAKIPFTMESGNHHPDSNLVYLVWNQTGDEDDPAAGFGQGWKYDANPFDVGVFPGFPEFGSIMVLCTHTDTKGVNWSVY